MTAEKKIVGRWASALRWVGLMGAAAVLAACGGGGGSSESGSLRVALTDAPSCGYDHVYVTVEKVRVHKSGSASDSEGGWTELAVSPARRIDLLDLTNGVLEELGTVQLSTGKYSQIRLVLASNTGTGASSVANAIQLTGDSTVIPLNTPSGQQSGLKLQAHFDVVAGQTADIVLDFDACKSIVKAGNSGNKYNLKPVLSVVPRLNTGIQGFVTTTLSLSSTTIAAQQDGVTIRSTAPDSTGKFSIPFLSTGTYTLVVMSDGRANAVVTGVPVTGTSTTVVSGTSTAIAPPVSSMADVTGTVTVTSTTGSGTSTVALTDATARALQTLTGGPVIELGNQAVDSELGTYRFRLPVAAPVKAPFVSSGPLVFTADSAVAGKYTIRMASPGETSQDKPADITGGPAVVNFNFGP
jgi:hypothetical protein